MMGAKQLRESRDQREISNEFAQRKAPASLRALLLY
jgi:hypothetical protein